MDIYYGIYIYIPIIDITSRIHIHIWRPPGRLNWGGLGGRMPPQESKSDLNHNWAELWLVKNIFYTVWVQIQWLEKIVYTSRFSVIFKNLRIVGKSLPHPVAVFSMLPNPSKCHIRQQMKKSCIFIIKLKIP